MFSNFSSLLSIAFIIIYNKDIVRKPFFYIEVTFFGKVTHWWSDDFLMKGSFYDKGTLIWRSGDILTMWRFFDKVTFFFRSDAFFLGRDVF